MLSFPIPSYLSAKTVSPTLVRPLMLKAQRIGISEAQFLQLTGITPADMKERIPGDKHMRMMHVLRFVPYQLSDLPRTLDALYPFCPELVTLLSLCETPRQATVYYAEHRCLVGELDDLQLWHEPQQIRADFDYEPFLPRSPASALNNFALLIHAVRRLLDDQPCRIAIELQGKLDIPGAQIGQMLDATVHFECKRNRLWLRSERLDTPSRHHHPLAERYLLARIGQLRSRLAARRTYAQSVRLTLEELLRQPQEMPAGDRIQHTVCLRLGLSRWTLARRLKEEGESFAEIWAQMRADEAMQLLKDTDLSIGQISERLGFGTQSSLTRFFRAHWGITPASYRHDCNKPGDT